MKIKFDKSDKLRKQTSLYVKCDYDEDCMPLIQSFGKKYYHASTKTWELDTDAFKLLMSDCDDVVMCGDIPKKYGKLLDILDTFQAEDLPYSSKTEPFSHQIESFNFALANRSFLLGDEMGLGKSKQSLDIAISRSHKFKHCLIICGVNSLKWNWLSEISTHTNERGHILGCRNGVVGTVSDRLQDLLTPRDELFLITNIETLRNKDIASHIQKMCDSGIIGMTIIDEIHKCKNYSSIQGKAIHKCDSYYKLALTGTPLMNRPTDLYNILKWLGYENHTYSQFENRYVIKGGYGGYQVVGYQHLDELQHLLDRHMLRRKKDTVIDLPQKIHVTDTVELGKDQQSIYNEVEEDMRQNVDKILLNSNPLSRLTRLRQATSCPHVLTTKGIANAKFERVIDIIEGCEDKVIVFSNFTSVINPLADYIKEFNPAVVTGETKDVEGELHKFKTDKYCRAILGTIPCLGTGFTLTEASTVIFIDEPWTMANKVQAEDRAHRIGATKTVTIYTLLAKDTIDERINKIVSDKGMMSDYLVDAMLTEDDIRYLLEGEI